MRRRTEKDNYQDISGRGEDKMKKKKKKKEEEKKKKLDSSVTWKNVSGLINKGERRKLHELCLSRAALFNLSIPLAPRQLKIARLKKDISLLFSV